MASPRVPHPPSQRPEGRWDPVFRRLSRPSFRAFRVTCSYAWLEQWGTPQLPDLHILGSVNSSLRLSLWHCCSMCLHQLLGWSLWLCHAACVEHSSHCDSHSNTGGNVKHPHHPCIKICLTIHMGMDTYGYQRKHQAEPATGTAWHRQLPLRPGPQAYRVSMPACPRGTSGKGLICYPNCWRNSRGYAQPRVGLCQYLNT